MKNGKITGKLRWQPDTFRAETTHQLYLLCLHTDGWQAYVGVIPAKQHRVVKKQKRITKDSLNGNYANIALWLNRC